MQDAVMTHAVSPLLRAKQSWRNQNNLCVLRKSLFLQGIPRKKSKISIFVEF
jgi:hypothetical protein